jgi:hypothetical protein
MSLSMVDVSFNGGCLFQWWMSLSMVDVSFNGGCLFQWWMKAASQCHASLVLSAEEKIQRRFGAID